MPEIIEKAVLSRTKNGSAQLFLASKGLEEKYKELFGERYNYVFEKARKISLFHKVLNKYFK